MINTNKIIQNILGNKRKTKSVRRKLKQDRFGINEKQLGKDLKYIKKRDEAYKELKEKYNFVEKIISPWNKIMRVGSILDLEEGFLTILGSVHCGGKVKVVGVLKSYDGDTLVGLAEDGDIVEFGLGELYEPTLTEGYSIINY